MVSYDIINSKTNKRNIVFIIIFLVTVITVPIVLLITSDDNKTAYNIPAIKPPVQDSVPSGLDEVVSSRRILDSGFTFAGEVKSRFFSGNGPTNVYKMLSDIDGRTQSLNSRSNGDSQHNCLTLDPVEIEINNWAGDENITLWIQCYEQLGDNLFIMFGRKDDKVYLYERGLATTATAIITLNPPDHSKEFPCCYQVNGGGSDCTCYVGDICKLTSNGVANSGNCRTKDSNSYDTGSSTGTLTGNSTLAEVNLYFSVGAGWDSETETGSRGLMHLVATPQNGYFQASVAGIGLGFCGVQFASNGNKMLFIGSQDGVGGGCKDVNSTCVSGDLLTEYDIEDCNSDIGFSILPLGRETSSDYLGNHSIVSWNSSTWPSSGNNVDISDISTSPVYFGPSAIPVSLLGIARKF